MTSPSPSVPSPIVACPRHPAVETALTCGRCETPICPQCMVHSPGGIRCPDCAQMKRLPMYTIGFSHIARAVAGGIAVALPLGVLGAFILPPTGRSSFFMLFFALFMGTGAGTLVAEAITRASGGKRGPVMIGIAVAALVAAWGVRVVLSGASWEVAVRDLVGFAIVGFGIAAASNRLR
ncbi:MAG: hypothetical protein Q8M79_08465 [Dehalococcoidia bacterium]|nr:hypothetical protein [Dehalococcoidia bacterium]